MKRLTVFLLLVAVFLAACSRNPRLSATPPRSPAPASPIAPGAPDATFPLPGPSPVAGAPAAVPTPIQAAPPLGADGCSQDLQFVSDLTVPDGAEFTPGEAIDKRWKVRNTGSCAWGPEFRIVLVGGDAMGSPTEIALYPALPGVEGIVRAQLTAPQQSGDYTGTWQARDPQGNLFGNKMWVRITVAAS